ncbi:hypothetical protein Y032_0040g176 [Ancylostoma ceylanicum]|uniref:Uncharacterized protein n=1 Tax=Ancylostoma ceylanicum TaxID=53326 RepID=A0A016UHS0_9BILA|nr:hypothetical protein Y032_0040g176 [Ancylostoma ceylanicum]
MDFTFSTCYLGDTKVRFFERFDSHNNVTHESYRSNEENVVDQIENAQIDGILPVEANELQKVNVRVSKHGVWISRNVDSTTVDRIPLVNIVFSLAYDDGFNKLVKVELVERNLVCVGCAFIFAILSVKLASSDTTWRWS